MNKISLFKTVLTGIHLYISGSEKTITQAMRVAYYYRNRINCLIENGFDEEEIIELLHLR